MILSSKPCRKRGPVNELRRILISAAPTMVILPLANILASSWPVASVIGRNDLVALQCSDRLLSLHLAGKRWACCDGYSGAPMTCLWPPHARPFPALRLASTGEHEPWRKLIVDHPVHATDEDSGEVIDIKPTQDDPNHIEGLLIGFRYVDAQGNKSRRIVPRDRRWIAHGVLYVRGYCSFAARSSDFSRRSDDQRRSRFRTKQGICRPGRLFFAFADVEGTRAGL